MLEDQIEPSGLFQHFFPLSFPLSFSISFFLPFWKIELFSPLKMCFELNAQLHNSCYITCGLALCSSQAQTAVFCCFLLPCVTVVCGFKHWFIWCPGSESSKLYNTLGMSSHYSYAHPWSYFIEELRKNRSFYTRHHWTQVKGAALGTGYNTCPLNVNKYLPSIFLWGTHCD